MIKTNIKHHLNQNKTINNTQRQRKKIKQEGKKKRKVS